MDFFLSLPDRYSFLFGPSKWYVLARLARYSRAGRWTTVAAKAASSMTADELTTYSKWHVDRESTYEQRWILCLCDYGHGTALTASLYSRWAQAHHRSVDLESLSLLAGRAIRDEKRKARRLNLNKGDGRVRPRTPKRKRNRTVR